jgi:hypothetical protein
MRRTIVASFCSALLAASTLAQSDNRPRPDGFRGLVLNQTTAKDAIDILGQPAEDKIDRLDVSKIDKWLGPKHKEKIFRHLTFKKIGDFRTIELSFLGDKLMMIELEFGKTLNPEKLRNLFGVAFAPVGGWSDLPDQPGQYPRPFLATRYPQSFAVVGISDQAFIWANCSASSTGVPTSVDRTRQISRSLEKK